MKPDQIPTEAEERYDECEDLMAWMGRQFSKRGDIFKASIHGKSAYVIRDPGYAHHVLVENWQNYVKGQFIKRVALLLGNGLMVSKGDLWKKQRRTIQPAFHGKAIESLTELIISANIVLLKKWQEAAQKRQSVNITRDVSSMVLYIVLASIFGTRDYERVATHFSVLSDESSRNMEFAYAFRSLGRLVKELINKRREEGSTGTDILGMLMQARDSTGSAMPDRQLVDEIITLIVAGHETTASTLNWVWYLISQHPDVEAKLSEQLDQLETDLPRGDALPACSYAKQIIEEALRLYPAGWLMTRRALKDDHLGGYFVPAGLEIYIPPYFIQRHPDLWADPDRFDPDRFSAERIRGRQRLAMLPFSAGPRNCIGEPIARLEMFLHLVIIAKKVRMKYVQTAPIELEAGVNLRSKHEFVMTPELRADASSGR